MFFARKKTEHNARTEEGFGAGNERYEIYASYTPCNLRNALRQLV